MKRSPFRSTTMTAGSEVSTLFSASSNCCTPAKSNSPASATTVASSSCRVSIPSSATSVDSKCRALLRGEKGNAGREAVHEAALADRPDLAGGEEAGSRRRADLARKRVRVVTGAAEHVRTAAVAGEDQRTRGRAVKLARRPLERIAQVDVGGRSVTHV